MRRVDSFSDETKERQCASILSRHTLPSITLRTSWIWYHSPSRPTHSARASIAAHAIPVSVSASTQRKCCLCEDIGVYDRCSSGLHASLSDVISAVSQEARAWGTCALCQERHDWRCKLSPWGLLEVCQGKENARRDG